MRNGPVSVASLVHLSSLTALASPRFQSLTDPNDPTCVETNSPITHWKINMEPENDGLEDHVPFEMGDL